MRSPLLFSQFAKFYKKSPNAFFEETERDSYVFLAPSVPKIRFAHLISANDSVPKVIKLPAPPPDRVFGYAASTTVTP